MEYIDKVIQWEEGFSLYIKALKRAENVGVRDAWTTRKMNEGIRLMANADYEGMKQVVVNEWLINRALS